MITWLCVQWNGVQLELEARDRGVPPRSSRVRLDVEITRTSNAYPQWREDYTAIVARVSESAPVNTVGHPLTWAAVDLCVCVCVCVCSLMHHFHMSYNPQHDTSPWMHCFVMRPVLLGTVLCIDAVRPSAHLSVCPLVSFGPLTPERKPVKTSDLEKISPRTWQPDFQSVRSEDNRDHNWSTELWIDDVFLLTRSLQRRWWRWVLTMWSWDFPDAAIWRNPCSGFSKVCKVPVVLQGGLLAYIAPATAPTTMLLHNKTCVIVYWPQAECVAVRVVIPRP